MIRVTKGSDIKLFTSTINGLGDKYKIDFYTKRKDVFFSKTDLDVVVADEPYIPLFWRDLAMIGEGVLNMTVYNMTVDQAYDDGIYDNSFTRTTNYYIVNEEGDVPESLVERVEKLEEDLAEEITRSTEFDDNCVNLINTLSEDIEAEEDVREAADNELSARIDELSDTQSVNYADCIQRINSEAQTRSTNDQAQVAAIDNLSGRITSVEGQFELYYPKTQVYNKNEIDQKNVEIYTSIGSEESSRIAGDDNLQAQINQKANSADVYTKTAVDTLLNTKANQSTTYTKSEVDDAISDAIATIDLSDYETIANHNADIATLNTAIGTKANSADVYTKAETNQEIDDAIDAIDLSAYETIANHNADVATLNTAIGTKANSADVYTKAETDQAIDDAIDAIDLSAYETIANHNADVATLNTAIGTKANSADVYTKAETDQAIDDAIDAIDLSAYETIADHDADMANVYTKSEVYTKAEAVSQSQYSADMISLYADISDNELVVASALNDLNERVGQIDLTNYYDKTAVDTLLNAKANQSTTYTKTEVDTALASKADEATTLSGYGITDAYNKTEIDAMIGNINTILASI